MTKEQILADLDYASSLAKEGAETPLLGGPIGLMWGVLLSAVFFGQWGILSGTFGMPPSALAFMWIAFAIIGSAGSIILGRRMDNRPGANSVANRVECYVWIMFSGFMIALFLGVVANIFLSKGGPELFNHLVVAGFAGQGLAYGIIGKLTRIGWIKLASLAGFAASILCFAVVGDIKVYLIAAIATLFTVALPSIISIRNAP